MKIAFCSPLPPIRSGIADYSIRLLYYLSQKHSIDCFYTSIATDKEFLPEKVRAFHYFLFPEKVQKNNYDVLLFQMGNNIYHNFIYYFLQYYNGIVDLHDSNLHHFLAHIHSFKDYDKGYQDLMEKKYFSNGKKIAEMSRLGIFAENQCFILPLGATIFSSTRHKLIVHSQHAKKYLNVNNPKLSCSVIMPPIDPTSPIETEQKIKLKQLFGLQPDSKIILSLGEILPKKGSFQLVSAFRKLSKAFPSTVLLFVGTLPDYMTGFSENISDLISSGKIRITGYVDDKTYHQLISICDIGVNLRFPTVGETSQSLLELMAAGKPVIVSKSGFSSELPNDSVISIPTGKKYVPNLIVSLNKLLSNNNFSKKVSSNARRYIIENHSYKVTIPKYEAILENYIKKTKKQSLNQSDKFNTNLTHTYTKILTKQLYKTDWKNIKSDKLAAVLQKVLLNI